MRVIKIDARRRALFEEEEPGTIEDIQAWIGDRFTVAWTMANRDTIYVDDEGLLKNPEYFFGIKSMDEAIFAGNGYVQGCDEEGRPIDVGKSLSWYRDNIIFLDREDVLVKLS